MAVTAVVAALGAAVAGYSVVRAPDRSSAAPSTQGSTRPPGSVRHTTSTTLAPTTTTTVPPVVQPADVAMPSPGNGLGWGSRGATVFAYEARLKSLHFDPGRVDGVFDQDTQYAVVSAEKYLGLARDGVIGAALQAGLGRFRYTPAQPKADGDRVEIDLDRQVLTVFHQWQPVLITTTSTGSGHHFCGGSDGCQYAITPTGHYHFTYLHRGWDNGKLGRMWNPYYFNGGIAVHGLASVPAYPASHGCARIPMHVADYFYTLVQRGESVYVVGTPMQPGGGYVGPPTTVVTRPTPTTAPTSTTAPHTTTTKPSTTTTKPNTTTTKGVTTTT